MDPVFDPLDIPLMPIVLDDHNNEGHAEENPNSQGDGIGIEGDNQGVDANHPLLAVGRSSGQRHGLASRMAKMWKSLALYVIEVEFMILYSFYVHQALLSEHPLIDDFLLEASNANVLLSVFSQLFAGLTLSLLVDSLDCLRWYIEATSCGLNMSIFASLSSAIATYTTLLIVLRNLLRPAVLLVGLVR